LGTTIAGLHKTGHILHKTGKIMRAQVANCREYITARNHKLSSVGAVLIDVHYALIAIKFRSAMK